MFRKLPFLRTNDHAMEKFVSTRDVASSLGISLSTVYRYLLSGDLQSYKIGSRIRIKEKDLVEFLARHRRTTPNIGRILQNKLTKLRESPNHKAKGGQSVASHKKGRQNFSFGSVYQRRPGGRWTIDFRGPNGRVQRVIKWAKTGQEAREALRNAILEAYLGKEEREGESVTFDKLSEIYVKDWAKTNKLGSWKSDVSYLKSMKAFFKDRVADSISSQDIEQYKAKRRSEGVKLSTVNRCVSILSKLFNCAVSWGYLKSNPCKGVKKFPEKSLRRTRVLSREEEGLLMNGAEPGYLRSMLIVFINTGLRRKELLHLAWENVDFKRRRLFIRETKTFRSRHVPMNELVMRELENLFQSRNDDGPVFRNPQTGRAFVDIKRSFARACLRAKIKNLLLKDLRRTFATRLLEAGVDIVTCSELLGHTSLVTTRIYTMTDAERKAKAVELLVAKADPASDNLVTKPTGLFTNRFFSVN